MCARIPVCRCAASRVWFYPNTHRLHIIDGHGANSNNECPIAEELPVGVATRVRIVAETAQVSVYYDDVYCNCAIFWGDPFARISQPCPTLMPPYATPHAHAPYSPCSVRAYRMLLVLAR